MEIAYSVNGVPIRLTEERWHHIVNSRDEMAPYFDDCLRVIEDPDLVLGGYRGSLKAVKGFGRNRYLVVIYKELSADDGFVITAYLSKRSNEGKLYGDANESRTAQSDYRRVGSRASGRTFSFAENVARL